MGLLLSACARDGCDQNCEQVTQVSGTNIAMIATITGAREFHSSLRKKIGSAMEFIHPGFASSEESYSHWGIVAEEVEEMKKVLVDTERELQGPEGPEGQES